MQSFLLAASGRSRDASYVPETRESCCEKYKRIFTLRNRTDESAVPEMIALFHGTGSVLLRHEAAYTLGQMQRLDAVPFLEGLLMDPTEDPVTRHEAAEALGAIEAPESLSVLERHAVEATSVHVRETCALALAQLNYEISKGTCGCDRRPQEALRLEALAAAPTAETGLGTEMEAEACPLVRPAEPLPAVKYVSPVRTSAADAAPLPTLRTRLHDHSLPLFDRYRALFALRDAVPAEGEAAVSVLCDALSGASSVSDSALLKHEVAFVLGQLEHPAATTSLAEAVRREGEHGMVRHEAAEALGAIGTPEAVEVLRDYCAHEEEILRESCWVALMWLE